MTPLASGCPTQVTAPSAVSTVASVSGILEPARTGSREQVVNFQES